MEAWREELYLQHGLFDNLRQKVKSAASVVKSTASNAYTTIKKTSNTAANSIKTKAGDINREWKNHKYIRKEEKGNKVRYIYPEDLKKKVKKAAEKTVNAISNTAEKVNKIRHGSMVFVDQTLKRIRNRSLDAITNTFLPVYYNRDDILHRSSENKMPGYKMVKKAWQIVVDRSYRDMDLIERFDQLNIKKRACSPDDDQFKVNPLYKKDESDMAYRRNCSYCSAAYELRRRGYDVEALPAYTGRLIFDANTFDDIRTWFENPIPHLIKANNSYRLNDSEIKNIKDNILSEGNGTRGFINVNWISGSAHSMIWEVEDNNIIIRDAQTNKSYDAESILYRCNGCEYYRTDNLKVTEKILKHVRNQRDWSWECFLELVEVHKKNNYRSETGNMMVRESSIVKEDNNSISVRVVLDNGIIQIINYDKVIKNNKEYYVESSSKIIN